MRISKSTIAAVGAAGLLALAVPALGQEGGDPPQTTSPEAREEARKEAREGARVQRQQRLAEELATELDLPVEDVAAALEAVHDRLQAEHHAARLGRLQERLAAAVEAGDLTQDQADAILEAAEAGVLPFGGRGRHHGR